jgi:surfactin synthase thioesterase subunit
MRRAPGAELHIVDGGHFALDTAASEMADHIRNFLSAGDH